jgi:hypothetical protein
MYHCSPVIALGNIAIEFRELHKANGALQVGHTVVEAEQVELGQ